MVIRVNGWSRIRCKKANIVKRVIGLFLFLDHPFYVIQIRLNLIDYVKLSPFFGLLSSYISAYLAIMKYYSFQALATC